MKTDAYFMDEAIKEAEKSLAEGGIPIGECYTILLHQNTSDMAKEWYTMCI